MITPITPTANPDAAASESAPDIKTVNAKNSMTGGWKEIRPRGELVDEKSREEFAEVSTSLARLLNSENLVILAGLGTSLGIYEAERRLAPTMNDLWAAVILLPTYEAAVPLLTPAVVNAKNFEHLLSDAIGRQTLIPDSRLSNFIQEAEQLVLAKCSFVRDDTAVQTHEVFLRKVARRSTRLLRTQLFTTNYDRAFEVAAANTRFSIIDGFGMHGQGQFDGSSFDLDFVRRRPGEQLALEPNVLQLLKLHGSVDWDKQGDQVLKSRVTPENPVLIYPSQNKFQLSYQQPYLESMARFQMALRQNDVGLLIVGFGFNDAHIVAPIEAAIRSNIGLRVAVVTPDIRSADRSQALSGIERLVDAGDRRPLLLEATFDDLTRLLPDIPPLDERDIHNDRVAKSREPGRSS